MAVILQMTYQKKLGLPNFSSHSCSVSLTVEIADVGMVGQETTKLYQLLQTAVDNQIQEVGYMPDATTYGMNNGTPQDGPQSNGNGYSPRRNGNTHQRPSAPQNSNGPGEVWNCTDGQRGLILRIVNENQQTLTKDDVEGMAQQMFGAGVKQLDKMQASQLIEELLERVGKKPQRSRWQRQPARQ
jgi:hypothetical protein